MMTTDDGDMAADELTNQRIVDRLVDGELSEADRRRVLSALEAQPDGWRRCALAFLEHQELGRVIPQMTAALEQAPRLRSKESRNHSWTGLLALAATAFFAFVLGLQSDNWLRSREMAPAVAEQQAAGTSAKLVKQPQSGIPLEVFLNRESVIPPQFRQTLEQSGNVVQTHRGLVPGRRSDGTQILVPYEELQIVPTTHMTY